jgi:hypothetical protein
VFLRATEVILCHFLVSNLTIFPLWGHWWILKTRLEHKWEIAQPKCVCVCEPGSSMMPQGHWHLLSAFHPCDQSGLLSATSRHCLDRFLSHFLMLKKEGPYLSAWKMLETVAGDQETGRECRTIFPTFCVHQTCLGAYWKYKLQGSTWEFWSSWIRRGHKNLYRKILLGDYNVLVWTSHWGLQRCYKDVLEDIRRSFCPAPLAQHSGIPQACHAHITSVLSAR